MQLLKPLLDEDFDASSFAAGFYSASQLDSFLAEADASIDDALRSLGPKEEAELLASLSAKGLPANSPALPEGMSQRVSDLISQNVALQARVHDVTRRIEEFMTIQRVGILLRGSLVSLASYLRQLPSLEKVQAKVAAGDLLEAERMLKIVARARWLFESNPDLNLLASTQAPFRQVQDLHGQLTAFLSTLSPAVASPLSQALG